MSSSLKQKIAKISSLLDNLRTLRFRVVFERELTSEIEKTYEQDLLVVIDYEQKNDSSV